MFSIQIDPNAAQTEVGCYIQVLIIRLGNVVAEVTNLLVELMKNSYHYFVNGPFNDRLQLALKFLR